MVDYGGNGVPPISFDFVRSIKFLPCLSCTAQRKSLNRYSTKDSAFHSPSMKYPWKSFSGNFKMAEIEENEI